MELHGVTTQKTLTWIFITVKTSVSQPVKWFGRWNWWTDGWTGITSSLC